MYKRFCHKHAGISRSPGTNRHIPKLFKMKMIIVALALVAVVVAAPTEDYPKIVRSEYNVEPDGSFTFNFETENGIVRSETGVLKEVLDEDKKPHLVVVVRGSYTYTNPDGKPETINYFADEGGYHAEGDSIPKELPVTGQRVL